MNLPETLRGLEHLSGGVILLDGSLLIAGLNPAAENLFGLSDRQIRGLPLESAFVDAGSLRSAVASALHSETSFTEHELELESTSHLRHAVSCTATPVRLPPVRLLLELHPLDSRLRIDREERQRQEQTTNRMLIGNLAHEIKNPLGGIRGAAQLLAAELPHAGLQEYTQVIISEVDRLRTLVDRLLTPHVLTTRP